MLLFSIFMVALSLTVTCSSACLSLHVLYRDAKLWAITLIILIAWHLTLEGWWLLWYNFIISMLIYAIQSTNKFFFLHILLSVGYRSSARESKATTLTVPEQQRTTHHRSRSVSPHRGDDQGRPRSRLPNVPLQR